jgi:hypothetical protein
LPITFAWVPRGIIEQPFLPVSQGWDRDVAELGEVGDRAVRVFNLLQDAECRFKYHRSGGVTRVRTFECNVFDNEPGVRVDAGE